MTKGKILEWLLQLGLGGFFIWSGAVKVMDLPAFLDAVENYQAWFSKPPYDAVVAYTLPWVEIFAGLAVATGLGKQGGLLIIMGMLASFCLALKAAWDKGLNINCGCYSKSSEPVDYPWKLAENTGLFLVALVLLVLSIKAGWKEKS